MQLHRFTPFSKVGTPPGGVGHELSAIRNVLRESRGSFSGSLLLSISLLSVRQPITPYGVLSSLISQWIMASDLHLQGDYSCHSTLSQEVAAKSRMPKAWVRIDVLGRPNAA